MGWQIKRSVKVNVMGSSHHEGRNEIVKYFDHLSFFKNKKKKAKAIFNSRVQKKNGSIYSKYIYIYICKTNCHYLSKEEIKLYEFLLFEQ